MLPGIVEALECQEFLSNYLYGRLSWLPDNPIYGSLELMGYGTQKGMNYEVQLTSDQEHAKEL
jgi:hypothetical protein